MGMVTRRLEFRDREALEDYLKLQHGFELPVGENSLKDIELGDIMVNGDIEELEGETVLNLKKLVSLKAFLLSSEAGMDINKLVFDIDSLMDMSEDGLNLENGWISDDQSLMEFFRAAGIEKSKDDEGILEDGKRRVRLKRIIGKYDFNSIVEI